MADFEFLSPDDKPALCLLSNESISTVVEGALRAADYVVHSISQPEEFLSKFTQAQYLVCVIEEGFGGGSLADNAALHEIQHLAMTQRRHCVFILVGDSFQSLHPMQAFQQSVQAVVNPGDLGDFPAILTKVVNENDSFLATYNDVMSKISQG